MKVVLTLCIIIALCGTIFAANNHSFGYVEPTVIRECKPIWKGLESLSQTERQNAILKIELPKEKSIDMIEHSSLVENKWNSGNYAGAIELFRNFADLQDVSCGIQWKEPIKTESKWGEDVQIGSREDIYVVNLDVENANGNLFAAFLYPEDTQYKWSVYISEDTGKTWLETYIWWASFYINDISAVVAGNYFFVGYTHNGIDSLTSARVRRFDTDSGYVDGDYGWIEVFDHGITIEDIALTSNADYYNDRVYYTAIQSDNSLCFYWNYPLNANWLDSNPLVNDALRGLDICTNKPYSVDEDIFSYVSYINTDDSVVVLGINYIGIWQNYGAIDYSGCLWAGSSISAYYDTVITMFPHYGASNPWVKYRISYDAGAFWYWWFVG
ncbi:hypothetical protein KAX35_08380, partial [candidate division WOR-3 bacterium]|nr:hypothetical protein [candidate division WOR-3 bacterium]